MSKVLYTAIVLDEESQNRLRKLYREYYKQPGWKEICHHMTLKFGDSKSQIDSFIESNLNKSFTLKSNTIGISEKAIALKIDTDIKTLNSYPHITVAVNSLGGKPVDSNNIKRFIKLPINISLTGTLQHVYR